MSNTTQYEREEQQLDDDLSDGRITQAEYNSQMRDLQRDYRDSAHASAADAYEQELGNW
jgi:hypothetical protein